MRSFKLFKLLKSKENLHFTYIFTLISPEIYYARQVTSFHEKKSNILHQIVV